MTKPTTLHPLADRAIRYHINKYVKPHEDLYEDLYNSAVVHVLEAVAKGLDLNRKGAISYLNKRLHGRVFGDYRRLISSATLSNTRAERASGAVPYTREFEPGDETAADHLETQVAVHQALDTLDETERAVVVGITIEGKDEWSIACELSLLPMQVADIYEEASAKLRGLLK